VGIFLRNHDELTLEMVTEDERDYMYAEYAADPRMRKNLGIRRRLAPLVENDRRIAELLHALLLSLPGAPVLVLRRRDRDGRQHVPRGPRHGAHSDAVDSRPQRRVQQRGLRPVGAAAPDGPGVRLPVGQRRGPDAQPSSFLHWLQRMLGRAPPVPGVRQGDLEVLPADNPSILAYCRSLERDDGGPSTTVLCVNNLSRFAQSPRSGSARSTAARRSS